MVNSGRRTYSLSTFNQSINRTNKSDTISFLSILPIRLAGNQHAIDSSDEGTHTLSQQWRVIDYCETWKTFPISNISLSAFDVASQPPLMEE